MLTNPDMLHMTILPQYKDFARLLSNLKYVVVDEAHCYSGAFGCHTAIILRRLRRICARVYGASPTFIVCTATCANPQEHAQTLVGVEDWCAVGPQDDGSPCGDKTFVLWNPPIIGTPAVVVANRSRRRQTPAARDPAPVLDQRRCSPIVEVALLLAEMVQHNLRCLAFCKTRKLSELVLSYTKDMLRERAPEARSSVVRVPVGVLRGRPAQDREGALRGQTQGCGCYQCAGAGGRHWVPGCDVTLGVPGHGGEPLAAGGAGPGGARRRRCRSTWPSGAPWISTSWLNRRGCSSRPIEAARLDCHNPEVLKQQVMCAAAEPAPPDPH